ncbi:peroxiredoxin [Vulcanisaeta thermophila]|uniref:peroxiredoxin n=1 Tax=Vulcanisaeta thermophila TaxID=867917 RepID=UPI000852B2F0|nr:peroxiredoxin [Vulcanisaeta thermophila]
MEQRKLGIVFASGAANRICCLAIYGAAALAGGYKVVVHLVNEGLVAFRKDVMPRLNDENLGTTYSPPIYVPYVETYLKNLSNAIKRGEFKDWYSFLKELKQTYGDRFKIYACPVAAQFYNVRKEDLVDIVDGIVGAETFLEEVYGGIVMYL